MGAQRPEERGIGIDGADRFDVLGKAFWVIGFGLGVEPVATTMRLQIGLPLKSVPLRWAKSWTQSGV
jgi:hypothetical protein